MDKRILTIALVILLTNTVTFVFCAKTASTQALPVTVIGDTVNPLDREIKLIQDHIQTESEKEIREAVTDAIKQAMARQIRTMLLNKLKNESFIKDWNDYLYYGPTEVALNYIDSYLDRNLPQNVNKENVKKAVKSAFPSEKYSDQKISQCNLDNNALENFTGDPNGWGAFQYFVNGPCNDVNIASNTYGAAIDRQAKEEEKKLAQAQAGQGLKSKETGEQGEEVTGTPGVILKDAYLAELIGEQTTVATSKSLLSTLTAEIMNAVMDELFANVSE